MPVLKGISAPAELTGEFCHARRVRPLRGWVHDQNPSKLSATIVGPPLERVDRRRRASKVRSQSPRRVLWMILSR